MVYDAGHWHGERCLKAVRELVPLGGTIDLLIISHSDADHMGDADKILKKFDVKQIIWTGFFRDKEFWKVVNEAIADEHEYAGASVLNLQSDDIEPGTEFALGDATVTFVAGWPKWTYSKLSPSERRNAISIVVRLEYRGHSVLFTGDTVGRRTDDLPNACKDAEKIIVGRHKDGTVPIGSDVMLAPHHGGNNGSSSCLIEAVNPSYVIFAVGHLNDHPWRDAAERYLDHGVEEENIFRTDLGDDESEKENKEWDVGRVSGCKDKRGDDDVEIVLYAKSDKDPKVEYRDDSGGDRSSGS